jgi:hypothetical protein
MHARITDTHTRARARSVSARLALGCRDTAGCLTSGSGLRGKGGGRRDGRWAVDSATTHARVKGQCPDAPSAPEEAGDDPKAAAIIRCDVDPVVTAGKR